MLHLDSRAPFQELIAHYSTDNKTGKYPKGEGAGPYDFPIELNVKLVISWPHLAECVSFQWPLHYAPKSLSRKSEMRGLNTVENERKSWHKSELICTKEYVFFLYIVFPLPQN